MITIEGITNINDILKYKGKNVYIKRSDLVLGENEYLDEDLIGLDVIMNDKTYGKVVKIRHDLHQDIIIVNKEGTEYLVPYVCDIIKNINLQEGKLTLEYIRGLLD